MRTQQTSRRCSSSGGGSGEQDMSLLMLRLPLLVVGLVVVLHAPTCHGGWALIRRLVVLLIATAVLLPL